MEPDERAPFQKIDPDDPTDHDVVDVDQIQALKLQGERLLEESRSLNDMSRALLEEIDPSSV
ncbi:MAG: hypothetical protein ACRDKT_11250 [Actinomycetota bacterium]